MLRLLGALLLLSLWSCGNPEPKGPLYGTFWGGEGSRMILRSAHPANAVCDTLLIDHQGNFLWQPDTLLPGFYILEKQAGKQLTLLFTNEQAIKIDAQYLTFPEQCQTTDASFCQELKAIDDLSAHWQQALRSTSIALRDSGWQATVANKLALSQSLDSISDHYRQQALEISTHPLVRMYALLQQSGQRPLFHPWEQRQHYLALDSQLTNYQHLKEVAEFHQKTAHLLQRQQKAQLFVAGQVLPELLLDLNQGDSLLTSSLMEQPALLLFFDRQDARSHTLYQQSHEMLQTYRWSPLQIHVFHTDSLPQDRLHNLRPHPHVHYHQMTRQGLDELQNEGLLIQQPTVLLLNQDGHIAARNIWGKELQQSLDQLLQK